MQLFVPPSINAIDDNMYNIERIGQMASEEMSFENVEGLTTEACVRIFYKLTYETSAQVS